MAVVFQLPQSSGQRSMNICPTAGINPFDKPDGSFASFVVVLFKLWPKRLDVSIIDDDIEQIPLA